MDLQEETKQFINKSVKRFYSKAIENGAIVSEIEYVGTNLYKLSVGKLELTYMGKVNGTADIIGALGDVF